MRKLIFIMPFIVAFVFQISCKRESDEEIWSLPDLSMSKFLPDSVPDSRPVQFTLSCNTGEERKYSLKMNKEVRQRGKNMPSLLAQIELSLIMTEKIISAQDNICALNITFSNLNVNIQPDIEQIKNDVVKTFSNLTLSLSIDNLGKIVKIEKPLNTDIDTGSISRIVSELKEIRPVFPSRLLSSSDSWDSSRTEEEPLPGDGKNVIKISAVSSFKGFSDGNPLVTQEFKSNYSGKSKHGNITGDVSGEGGGSGFFVYDMEKKEIRNLEFRTAEHLKVIFGNKSSKGTLEELIISSIVAKRL
jgi:hypothetical protein